MQLESFTGRAYGGLELDVMATDRINLHYTFQFGEKYVHTPLAPYGGVFVGLLIGNTEDSTGSKKIGAGILFGLLTAIIPEGIGYSFPINDHSVIAPYVSPLQFEFLKRRDQKGGTDSYAGGGIGMKWHLLVADSKFRVTPYAEYKIHYHKDLHPGVSYGLNVAMNLSK